MQSLDADSTPWVAISDNRQWDLSTPDSEGEMNNIVDWMQEHNCISFAIVFSNQLQEFGAEKKLNDQSILNFSFDYDEAYQECLNKLAEAQS
ncbi:hypothetical protein L4C34_14850 [Vibrio profundum]|uniref:hypothetical protein n=1 Tax=Vibrio profundum TaxID=2910247 RepID=UPI003D096C4A